MSSIRMLLDVDSPYQDEVEMYYNYLEENVGSFFSEVGNFRYKVSFNEVRSTINIGKSMNYQGAKHKKIWEDLKDVMVYTQPNTTFTDGHRAEIFLMIHQDAQGSYPRLMNLLKKFLDTFLESDFQFNVVKYGYADHFESEDNPKKRSFVF